MRRRVRGQELHLDAVLCTGRSTVSGRDASVLTNRDTVEILGIDGMTRDELAFELQRGGRFKAFQFCASTFITACSTSSDIFFYRAGESAAREIVHYSFASVVLGWWSLPWGPVFTVRSLVSNLRGGKDVTQEVINSLKRQYVL